MRTFSEWLVNWWHVLPEPARAEFMQCVTPHTYNVPDPSARSESATQADIRIAASRDFGAPLWRNNSGAAQIINPHRPDDPPSHVRFGLGNDSKRLNDKWKSSDLIGITPVTITPDMVGQTLGVFTAIEVKKPGWKLTDGDKRAHGQNTFMTAVHTFGGFAGFAQSVADFRRIIKRN